MALSTSVILVTSPLGERKIFSNLKAAIISIGLNYQYLISPSKGDRKANVIAKEKEKDGTFRDGDGFEHKGWKFEKFHINKTKTEFIRTHVSSISSERLFRKTDNLEENCKSVHYILYDKGSPQFPAVYCAMGFVGDHPNSMATIMDHDAEVVRKQLRDRGFQPKIFKDQDPGILEIWVVMD